MGRQIVTRREWGARPPRSVSHSVRADRFKVHWTVGCVTNTRPAEEAAMRGIQAFHMGPSRGWADIAYGFVIGPTGTIYEGRGLGVRSAANGGGYLRGLALNYLHQAVALMAAPNCPATDVQLDALAWFLNEHSPRGVKGHRDGYATTCPGPLIYAWIQAEEWLDDLTTKGPSYWTWRAWRCSVGPWTGKGKRESGATYRPRIPRKGSPKWPVWWAKFRASGGC